MVLSSNKEQSTSRKRNNQNQNLIKKTSEIPHNVRKLKEKFQISMQILLRKTQTEVGLYACPVKKMIKTRKVSVKLIPMQTNQKVKHTAKSATNMAE